MEFLASQSKSETRRGECYERIDAVVDMGATYTVLPASTLRQLGVNPQVSSPFELADGSLRDFDIGETRVRVNGQDAATLVVFGEEDMEPLLAAYSLEGLRLAVDPVRGRPVSVPARLM